LGVSVSDDYDNYESGPFCAHWGELGDCEEICTECGHGCNNHNMGDECNVDGCDCEEMGVIDG